MLLHPALQGRAEQGQPPRLELGCAGALSLTVSAGSSPPPRPREAQDFLRTTRGGLDRIIRPPPTEAPFPGPQQGCWVQTLPSETADQFSSYEETLSYGCQERCNFTSYFSLRFEIRVAKQFHVAATDVISALDLLFQPDR